MDAQRWRQIEEIYHTALSQSPDGRLTYLAEACRGDGDLLERVRSLLVAAEQAGSFLETPALENATTLTATPKQVGSYRILHRVGAGGMGEVYRAHDDKLGRDVAVKMLPGEFAGNTDRLARLRREARTLASLNHPNIAAIYDLVENGGVTCLILEFVEGATLRGPLSIEQSLDYARQIAEGLEAAHSKGIVHRDLKPGNVKVTPDGRVKVLDFGLAKAIQASDGRDDSQASASAIVMSGLAGTPPYMSPEQARGDGVDARTDIWAFGCLLYELLAGHRAFEGDTSEDSVISVLEREPDWKALPPATPARIRELLRRCLQKDPGQRPQEIRQVREVIATSIAKRDAKRWRMIFAAGASVLIGVAILVWRSETRSSPAPSHASLAVLPFANLGAPGSRDYLRLALADELTTILSFNHSLAIRPFATTRKFSGNADPQVVGRNLGVADVITGDFRDTGDRIAITLEAINVENNSVLWRDSIDMAGNNLIALRQELSERIRTGLMPLLKVESSHDSSRPRNDGAYNLFLRAAALPYDTQPNKDAIAILDQAVQKDAGYAPAWTELGRREYYDGAYGFGGEAAFRRADEALTRALSLDPDLVNAAHYLITMRAGAGDLNDAYRQAKQLLARRSNSTTHFTMSFVLRYAGLFRESARECEAARGLDPHDSGLRSCSWVFAQLGDLDRAKQYLELDRGSEWAGTMMIPILMQQGDRSAALRVSESVPDSPRIDIYRAYLKGAPQNEVHQLALRAVATYSFRDAEMQWWTGTWLAAVGERDLAVPLLRQGVERGFCAFPVIDTDPALKAVRNTPEFNQIRQEAIACQQRFLEFRSTLSH